MRTVHFAGQLGTERADAFVGLLRQHFAQVVTSEISKLDVVDLDGSNLLVVDGEPTKDKAEVPEVLDLARFTTPTVLIGGVGGLVGDRLGLKLGWRYGCLCLTHQAIINEQDQQHPIFAGPVPVPAVAATWGPGSETFTAYAAVKDVPASFPLVDIHQDLSLPPAEFKAKVAELQAAGDAQALRDFVFGQPAPGLVTTSAGFFDSPDCEAILAGVNTKAHDYIAVGRQGRFLQWGFHPDPRFMTAVGQALFVNCLFYIRGFAGAPVEALRVQQPRDFLQVELTYVDQAPAEERAAAFRRIVDEMTDDTCGSTESALSWYEVNRGWIRHVGAQPLERWLLDTELRTLGLANDDPALPAVLARDLDAPGQAGELARRLWQRYLRRDADDAAFERNWLQENQGDLFFSDWAGYRWISRSDLPVLRPVLSNFAGDAQVQARLSAHRTGERVDAVITLMVSLGSHVYGSGATDGMPLTVEVASGYELVEPVDIPAGKDGHLSGNLQLPVLAAGSGDDLEVTVGFQACDAHQCFLPSSIRLSCVVTSDL